ncbi:hypothetical protein Fot_24445 [Forsythia ovata]|uniref:Transmembrane protein n=1 Tax=Forsythia ovata TaxID=205694 RepID=A0ABD1U692_9LAMI
MARIMTTTHHPEVRHSRRGTTTGTALPAITPPLAPVISPPPSIVPHLLLPIVLLSGIILSSSVPQPSVAREGPSTPTIFTRVTSQGKFDEDTSSDHGTGS